MLALLYSVLCVRIQQLKMGIIVLIQTEKGGCSTKQTFINLP